MGFAMERGEGVRRGTLEGHYRLVKVPNEKSAPFRSLVPGRLAGCACGKSHPAPNDRQGAWKERTRDGSVCACLWVSEGRG